MTSKVELVLRALDTALTAIDGNSPYTNDISSKVYREFQASHDVPDADRPCARLGSVMTGNNRHLLGTMKIVERSIPVYLYAKRGKDRSDWTQQEAIHSLVEDVYRAIRTDIQLGGEVISTMATDDAIDQGTQNMGTEGVARVTVKVKYEVEAVKS